MRRSRVTPEAMTVKMRSARNISSMESSVELVW